MFVAAGIQDIFLAYPVWADGSKADRIRALHNAAPRLRIGVDSVAGARHLAAAIDATPFPLVVLVEIDPGLHRTGLASPEAVVEVARAARDAGLVVAGVFSHGGHGYRSRSGRERGRRRGRGRSARPRRPSSRDGFSIETISAGSTPTMLTAAGGGVGEIRAGTYVYGDRQQWLLGAIPADGCALVVAATVVSVHADRIVLDAGAKALTKDRAEWLDGLRRDRRLPGPRDRASTSIITAS